MIVVTGGAGFIGSNIVKLLNDQGRDDILVVDDLKSGDKFKNLIGLKFIDYVHQDTFLEDIQDGVLYDGLIEAVFHEGACSDTMEYDCNFMMQTNYAYSKALLHFCVEASIPFLYASSASTYGSGKNGFTEGDRCEDALNIYAFSKLAFDRYVRRILPDADSLVIGLKYFNVYGPQEQHKGKMASIAYQFYNQVKASGKVKLFKGTDGYGDGEQRRDFVYVKDVAIANLWLWQHQAPSGIYNCGTGRAHTFNEVARAVIAAMGKGEIEYVDFPEVLKGKYQNYTQADLTELRKAGYGAEFYPLEKAIAEYCVFLEQGGYFSFGA